MHLSMLRPTPPPLYGDRWGIGGDLTHRMCQIPHPSITIQCQIPTLYIHTRICAGTRANACAGQKPHPWGVISWRIPYQAPPLSPTGGVGRNIDRRIIYEMAGAFLWYIYIYIYIIIYLYPWAIHLIPRGPRKRATRKRRTGRLRFSQYNPLKTATLVLSRS